jgi:DNA (cytosine-5)-methyltransferase 1
MIGIDLFAGAGGMSLGASMAGLSVEFAVELDRYAATTYCKNHPNTELYRGDVRSLTPKQLRRWIGRGTQLVLFGGPPCQGFSWSNARTRNLHNDENWLFAEFLRVVEILSPEWVVFENVQGIVDTASGEFHTQVTNGIEACGYKVWTALLNAMHYEVPQDRTRFFLVASRTTNAFRFPKQRPHAITVDEAIRDLPRLENGASQCWKRYGHAAPSAYARRLRQQSGCCNHLVTSNAPFVLQRYKFVPQGGNWQDIPARLMRNYADRSRCHTGIYRRLIAKAPSVVIGNYRKNMLIHPTQNRGLSVREAARMQSFPDSYTFTGSIGFQQQQVGNAVPPLLAKAVFKAVLQSSLSGHNGVERHRV